MQSFFIFLLLFSLYWLLAAEIWKREAEADYKKAYAKIQERRQQTDIFYYLENLLTPTQKECLPAARWLVNQNVRREGRTFLLAVAYIEEALRNPGRRIHVVDHYPTRAANEHLMCMIEDIVRGMENNPGFKAVSRGFKVVRGEAIVFWGPILTSRFPVFYPADPFKITIEGSWN